MFAIGRDLLLMYNLRIVGLCLVNSIHFTLSVENVPNSGEQVFIINSLMRFSMR